MRPAKRYTKCGSAAACTVTSYHPSRVGHGTSSESPASTCRVSEWCTKSLADKVKRVPSAPELARRRRSTCPSRLACTPSPECTEPAKERTKPLGPYTLMSYRPFACQSTCPAFPGPTSTGVATNGGTTLSYAANETATLPSFVSVAL